MDYSDHRDSCMSLRPCSENQEDSRIKSLSIKELLSNSHINFTL